MFLPIVDQWIQIWSIQISPSGTFHANILISPTFYSSRRQAGSPDGNFLTCFFFVSVLSIYMLQIMMLLRSLSIVSSRTIFTKLSVWGKLCYWIFLFEFLSLSLSHRYLYWVCVCVWKIVLLNFPFWLSHSLIDIGIWYKCKYNVIDKRWVFPLFLFQMPQDRQTYGTLCTFH